MSKIPLTGRENKVKEKYWLTKGLRYVLTLTILSAVVGLTLSIANQITAPIIAASEHERLMATLERLMPEADEYKIVKDNGTDIYFGVKNREVFAAAVPGEGRGFYGEPVEILTIVNTDGQINEVIVLRHKETPGLGDRILAPMFLAQFEGMTKRLAADEQEFEELLIEEIDIITGATVSSEAVVAGVAQAIDIYAALPPMD